MNPWVEIAKIFGVPVALLAFFVWRDYKRSKRDEEIQDQLATKLQANEDFQKNELLALAVENKGVVEQNTAAIKNQTETLKDFSQAFKKRPCMVEDGDDG